MTKIIFETFVGLLFILVCSLSDITVIIGLAICMYCVGWAICDFIRKELNNNE